MRVLTLCRHVHVGPVRTFSVLKASLAGLAGRLRREVVADQGRSRAGRTHSVRVVASLDRKRLGADFWGGAECRAEAFSIRRLGGSRRRLRRTRCAMGFERQPGSERGLGRAAKRGGNTARVVGMVLKVSQSVCG